MSQQSSSIGVRRTGDITDVGRLKLGHFQKISRQWLTGTSVVLCESGAVAGVDVRGGGPGTRETDLLRPENLIQRVHGIVLTGGSAYGLASADGVMAWLEYQRIGFSVGTKDDWVVPIVPAAVIFDLGRSGNFSHRPNNEFGFEAAKLARSSNNKRGNVGAGSGARAGGLKGGLGMASITMPNGICISALAVVNAVGSLINPSTCLPWSDSHRLLRTPSTADRKSFTKFMNSISSSTTSHTSTSLNTTIGLVATNFQLSKSECSKFASVAHDGLARAVRPAHLMNDGDTIFGLSVAGEELVISDHDHRFGDPSARPALLNQILAAGADAFEMACLDAILAATSTHGLTSYRDLCPSAFLGMP